MFAPVRTAKRATLAAVVLALLAVPAGAQQKPSGADVWGANCGRCHRARAVNAYNAHQWEIVTVHMRLVARLTADETEAVRAFLMGAARAREGALAPTRPAPEPVLLASTGAVLPGLVRGACCDPDVGRSLYEAQCVACHGKHGKGDGPAAAALNPRPPNLTDVARVGRLSDDSLALIIAAGRNTMPAYGKILTGEQIREVVAYLRTLKP